MALKTKKHIFFRYALKIMLMVNGE